MKPKSREFYLKSISIGTIVAFKNSDKLFSGKVIEIKNDKLTVQTKNCSVYYINVNDVAWVKNGTNWPVGIYNALKITRERK
nr:MAG TPA: Protein of unknown function (DUF2642) [Caudoviricetes sp.]